MRDRSDLPLPAESTWLEDGEALPVPAPGARQKGLEDLLQTLPDHPELEQLYQLDVPLGQLLRLLGHHVDARKLRALVRCDDPRREIRKLLRSA